MREMGSSRWGLYNGLRQQNDTENPDVTCSNLSRTIWSSSSSSGKSSNTRVERIRNCEESPAKA
uniref:Putative ribosomal protein L35 n=1 Tax=Citrus sinensis TaxID=2711 RepID=Q5TIK5_CITSI|nr:putative ribosomal protein L35 [Citrus sinensis]